MRSTEYPYRDAAPTCAHPYIWPALRGMLGGDKRLRVLDLGCGNGSLSRMIAGLGHEVVGVDSSVSGIEQAGKSYPECRFIRADICDLPYDKLDGAFDVVVSTETIEHLVYPRELMLAAKRCLEPGGRLILTTPYHGYVKNLVIALAGRTDRHFDPLWDNGHVKFFSKATLYALLKRTGFCPVEFRGAGRPFLWKSMVVSARKREDHK